MRTEFEQLEQDVDRELARLAGELRTAELDDAARDRVKAAVQAEALRLGPIASSTRSWPIAAARAGWGVAAAVLLVLAIRSPFGSQPGTDVAADTTNETAALDDWLAAAADSSEAVSMLYQETWLDATRGLDESGEDDPLDSLEDSFELLERVMGA